MSLITLTLAKEWIQINHSQQDNALQLMIDGAESFLAERLGVKFTSQDYIEDLDSVVSNSILSNDVFAFGQGARFLVPSNRPITAIDSVVDLLDDETEINFKQQGDLIVLTDENGIALGPWPAGQKRWRVSYTAGWDSDSIPPALKQAICKLVKSNYDGRGSGAAAMTPDIEREIQPFSRRRMAAS